MDDDQILASGGTQDDIDRIAHNNGACGAIYGGTCDYCGKTDHNLSVKGSDDLRQIISEEIYGTRQTMRLTDRQRALLNRLANKIRVAQNDATYAKVMEALNGLEVDHYVLNDVRQSIAKIFGKADAKPAGEGA